MKKIVLGATSMIVATSFISSVYAAEQEYFVELGDDLNKAEVAAVWNGMKKAHKRELSKLNLYPKDVFQGGQIIASRIQAGPIDKKTRAHKICKKLFSRDVPCFVIEGVKDLPPSAMVNISETGMTQSGQFSQLPWLRSTDTDTEQRVVRVESAPAVAETPFIRLPWLEDEPEIASARKVPEENIEAVKIDPEKMDRKALEELVKREANVEVAEAIRVPLSNNNTVKPSASISVSSLPQLSPAAGSASRAIAGSAAGSINSGAGWLQVSSFVNEEIASSLWNEVRMSMPKETKDLNSRIRSGVGKSSEKAQLSIGPFAHSASAIAFCNERLQAKDRGLSCDFTPNDSGMANNQMLSLDNSRSQAYQARRTPQQQASRSQRRRPPQQSASARQRPAQNLAALKPAAGGVMASNQYWVQVVTANSQLDALEKWEVVKARHGEVIGGLRSSVSTAANDSSTFVVRVGPIANNDDAIRVCSQLQQRNVSCRVLLYTTARNG